MAWSPPWGLRGYFQIKTAPRWGDAVVVVLAAGALTDSQMEGCLGLSAPHLIRSGSCPSSQRGLAVGMWLSVRYDRARDLLTWVSLFAFTCNAMP